MRAESLLQRAGVATSAAAWALRAPVFAARSVLGILVPKHCSPARPRLQLGTFSYFSFRSRRAIDYLSKFQIPSSKFQRNLKLQYSNPLATAFPGFVIAVSLGLGYW